jgi:CRP-like cAMP-binding protein
MNTAEFDPCGFPFLKSLPPEIQSTLLANATTVRYQPGEIIFRQGSPANRFFLIEEGQVLLEACSPRHTEVPVQTLRPGDALGWSWLFEPFTWNFQARAIDAVTVLAMDAAHLLRLSNENHDFGYELMKRLARVVICRLQATRRRLVEFADGQKHPTAA